MIEKLYRLNTKSEYGPNYVLCVRSYGELKEWFVYEESSHKLWYASGKTRGPMSQVRREAKEGLARTLMSANPISTKGVLFGLAVLGAVGAVFYAVNASAASSGAVKSAMPLTLSAADSGYPVSAAVGDGITITLDASQTWTVSIAGSAIVLASQSSGAAVFTATVTGSATITITNSTGTTTLTYPITVS